MRGLGRTDAWWLALLLGALVMSLGVLPWGTAVRDGPSVQVIGHHVPLALVDERITVGRGAASDLRLDEALIADRLGSLRVEDGVVRYQHEAAHRSALVTRPEGWGTVDDAFSNRSVPEGERVVVLSGLGALDDATALAALERICDGEAREGEQNGVAWAQVELIDAAGVWLEGEQGISTLLVPLQVGAERPVGEAVLEVVDDEGEPLARLRAGDNTWDLAPFAGGLPEELAVALAADPTLSEELGADRVIKQDAYLVVGDGEAAPVQPAGLGASSFDLGDQQIFLFRKGPGGESISPWFRPVDWGLSLLDAPPALQLARTPDHDGSLHVFDCDALEDCLGEGDSCPSEVGETALQSGEWLVAGAGIHYAVEVDDEELRLDLELPPAGRTRLLSSLSAGRLQAWGSRVEVPTCEAGRLVLRGTTSETQLPDGVEQASARTLRQAGDHLHDLPLPRWLALRHDEVQREGRTTVDLAALCTTTDEELVARSLLPPELPSAEGRFSSGERFDLAGHSLRYWDHQPLRDQRIPLAGFLLLSTGFIVVALREATGVASPRGRGPISIPLLLVLGSVAILVSAGGALQMRMAASDGLLGSPDYVQRHLITGYGASVLLLLGVRLGHRWRAWSSWRLLTLTGRTLGAGLLGLAAWLSVDLGLWALVGPPVEQLPTSDLVRAALARGVIAVWALGLPLFVGSLLLGRVDRPDPAWLKSLHPEVLAERLAEKPWMGWYRERRGPLSRLLHLMLDKPAGANGGSTFGLLALVVGLVVLVVGAALDVAVGSRWLAGFDLKPAEFTPTLIGLGIAGLLAGFSREQASEWWRVPARALGYTVLIGGLLLVCYGARADLGPLMVIVPSVVGMLALWAFPWDSGRLRPRRVLSRLAVFVVVVLALWGFVELFVFLTAAFQDQVTEIPRVGRSIERAIDRGETWRHTWYTAPGWWSTKAHWIAAGFYGEGREVYLSNLHNDLAFIALLQSWGLRRALLVLLAFTLLVGGLIGAGDLLLERAGGLVRRVGAATEDLPGAVADAMSDRAEVQARRWAAAGYFCFFAALYVASEVVVHIGTCFNTVPQTGITLPWVSSGGSAAMGFALLVGVACGLFARARAEAGAGLGLDERRREAEAWLEERA